MSSVVLVLHLVVAVALICLVLMQRSEGGALGMGGGSSSLISGRGAADVLARGTMVLAAIFLLTSITLTVLAGGARKSHSVIDVAPAQPSIFDTLFPKRTAPPAAAAPVSAAPAAAAPLVPPPAATGDIVPPPAESMQRAAPLEGPTVATLPPVSAAPAAEAPKPAAKPAAPAPSLTLSSAKPAVSVAAPKPAVSAAPALASAKPAKPAVHSGAPATASGAESGQPAPPPSRAGPDE